MKIEEIKKAIKDINAQLEYVEELEVQLRDLRRENKQLRQQVETLREDFDEYGLPEKLSIIDKSLVQKAILEILG